MRRRRPRVVWLPNARQNRFNVAGDSTDSQDSSIFDFILDVPNDGTIVTGIIGVVSDQPASLAFAGTLTSLSDLESSGYRLRRLVGKIFVNVAQDDLQNTTTWTDVLVTAGFIILRVQQDGVPTAGVAGFGTYATNILASVGDPWIWRRTWQLGNNAARLAQAENTAFQPESNTTLGSALDGPHLDQKTARVIGPEERLFFVVSAQGNRNGQLTVTNRIVIRGDVRVLASMRTSSGNRKNASR